MGWIVLMFVSPLLTALLAAVTKDQRRCELCQAGGAGLTLLGAAVTAAVVIDGGPVSLWQDVMYIDALGAFNIALIGLIGFAAALYSVDYLRCDVAERIIGARQVRAYYVFFHLFILTMLMVSTVNSLGLLWVGIELTTLLSAVLVAFYGKSNALEAAWKYLIMGSVGIAFALLGIIFIYLSGIQIVGQQSSALNWTVLFYMAEHLNPQWVKIGFIFVLIGFGAKAGLAPMHFWLPDAYSQAPSPISAVLSGVLLNTTLYSLLRIYAIANATLGGEAAQYLVFFGLLSIAFTVPFILVQHDVKRMVAYSSVEHVGIMAISIGIGGSLGMYAAFFHMFNHSMVKSLLFFTVGIICRQYRSRKIHRISGILNVMPRLGCIFLVAALAIVGAPPFNIFFSEFMILMAAFQAGQAWLAVLVLTLIVTIFAGMMYYVVKMAFGQPPAKIETIPLGAWTAAAFVIPLTVIVVCGWYIPPVLDQTFSQVAKILQGAGK